MKSNKYLVLPTLFLTGLVWTGCQFSPDFELPPLDVPSSYNDLDGGYQFETGITTSNRNINEYWWEEFGDEQLNLLVEEALRNNTDYAIAATKVAQARAALGIAQAEYFPIISLDATASRRLSGQQSPSNAISGIVSYELDLWGRVRESDKAATASLLAIAANQETIRLGVISGVLDSYFSILGLEEQKKILESTVKTYEESYEYRLKQYEAGGIEEIILEQSKVQLESAKANLFAITRQRSEAISALSLLVGRSPRGILAAEYTFGELLPKAPTVPLGAPSTLIRYRPDIKMAEENLKSANHSIGVARASYFPVLSLSALAGLSSSSIGKLFDGFGSSAGVNLAGPLFDFGRIANKVESAEAKKAEAIITYKAAVARAFAEVRNALVARENSEKRLKAIQSQATSQGRVYEIAKRRFEAGYSSHLELLDAERNWLSVQLTLSAAKSEVLSSSLSLYKALGGGFNAKNVERDVLYGYP